MVKASSFERVAPPSSSNTESARSYQATAVLTNGRLASRVNDAGAGGVMFGNFAITRWVPDATLDDCGQWLFIRDLQTDAVWSATAQPMPGAGVHYETHLRSHLAEFTSHVKGIETRLEVCVPLDDDVELRRITVVNRGGMARRIELTTYSELVLNTPKADVAHPAFSKLFVQTRYDASHRALVAWRRLRSPNDTPLIVAQAVVGVSKEETLTHETDRMRFVGRGRTLAAPLAIETGGDLSGTIGNVLDPIFARRVNLSLDPGEERTLTIVLGAARDERALSMVSSYSTRARVNAAFDAAARAVGDAPITRTSVGSAKRKPVHATSGPSENVANDLIAFNGFGGFSPDGDEYVIRIPSDDRESRLPPLPWCNVVANEHAGFIASETGAGYTWTENSRENRLTPWHNNPISDPHSEAFWIRDEESGEFGSPLPGPTPDTGGYEVRHGFGYSRWTHESAMLVQETWMFVPRHDPVKITRILVTNRGDAPRHLSLFSYAHLALGGVAHETAVSVQTELQSPQGPILARNNARGEFSRRTAFAAIATSVNAHISCTGDRTAFVGFRGSLDAPAAVSAGHALDGRTGAGLDPCAAFHASFVVEPGETVECLVLLGEAADDDTAHRLVKQYSNSNSAAKALSEVRDFWRNLVTGIRIETPARELDLMVNGWLTYQNLSCRMWGRSAFYQSGGAFGFRDQLQDSAALIYLDPSITRQQIVLHAAHQFVEGDVLHWWHPPTSKGIRTRFSDDLLWLPYVAAFYARTTGDSAVFEERVPYLRAKLLDRGEDEVFLIPEESTPPHTVYDHCCQAIDRSLTRGAHWLPLMGVGDWNDGMNRVGREGKGESVWLGFFLHDILCSFIPICVARGDIERARRYTEYQTELRFALNSEHGGWDGDWYRRAYYDDGTPLGSRQSDECRIDAIAQAWSVLSGAAPADRAERALDAMEEHLVSERDGVIRLLTPAFDKTPHDPGYIKGYLPGVRENGGQYTHGALWAVRALAETGRRERAAKLLTMLSPVSHGDTSEKTRTYMAEPYVIAADVYGVAPHVGRAGWTWYTGSAGWMYRVALESILGFEIIDARVIKLTPCIPTEWSGFKLTYRIPRRLTGYELQIHNVPSRPSTSWQSPNSTVRVAGGSVFIDLVDDAQFHVVEIQLAADVGRRYEESKWQR